MKDDAPFLDMPNNMKPDNYNTHFVYGKDSIHPCNTSALKSDPEEIMNQVLRAK